MNCETGRSVEIAFSLAERELWAFTTAVAGCYGPELRQVAADLWIDEFLANDDLPPASIHAWRQITSATAARFAAQIPPVTGVRSRPD